MAWEYAGYLVFTFFGTRLLQRFFGVGVPVKRFLWAVLPVAAAFVAWDALAVHLGHWSFSPAFLLGVFIGNQPVEELAFFFVVPFFYVTVWEIAKARRGGPTA